MKAGVPAQLYLGFSSANVENEEKPLQMLRFLLLGMFLFLLYRKWLMVSKSNEMAGSLAIEGPGLLAHVKCW